MLSISDIKKLTDVFATKQDLEELKETVATKEESRQVMTKLDSVYGEIIAVRQEQTAHYQQHEDINHDISSFKKRIENIPVIAHQIKSK